MLAHCDGKVPVILSLFDSDLSEWQSGNGVTLASTRKITIYIDSQPLVSRFETKLIHTAITCVMGDPLSTGAKLTKMPTRQCLPIEWGGFL
jgi:hypothetical protein